MDLSRIVISILLICNICACRKVHVPLTDPVPEPTPVFHVYDGQLGINDNSAIISYDSNIVICGNQGQHILVFKISKKGDLIWKKLIQPGRGSVASGIAETKDHHLVICGHTDINYDQSLADIMVIKLSETGDSLWTKTYGGTQNDTAYNIISTSDDNMLIAAKTESFGAYNEDLYLLKITPDGNELWTKKYDNGGNVNPNHLIETKEGGYLVTGAYEDNNSYPLPNLYLFKVNSAGNYLWKNSVFGNIYGYSTVELENGDLLTCGSTLNSSVFLHKTNSSGVMLWEQELFPGSFTNVFSIKENLDHTFGMTGYFKPSRNAKKIILFMKIDNNGKSLLVRKFGEPINNEGLNLIKDNNGDNLIIGQNERQIFLTRLGTDGKFK
jgi:hypothetical protein